MWVEQWVWHYLLMAIPSNDKAQSVCRWVGFLRLTEETIFGFSRLVYFMYSEGESSMVVSYARISTWHLPVSVIDSTVCF